MTIWVLIVDFLGVFKIPFLRAFGVMVWDFLTKKPWIKKKYKRTFKNVKAQEFLSEIY